MKFWGTRLALISNGISIYNCVDGKCANLAAFRCLNSQNFCDNKVYPFHKIVINERLQRERVERFRLHYSKIWPVRRINTSGSFLSENMLNHTRRLVYHRIPSRYLI